MTQNVSVILVDDHPLFRRGLEHLLQGESDHGRGIRITGQFSDLPSVQAWLAEGGRADVVLLDRNLRDADGLELVPELKKQGMRVIMLTIAEEDCEIRDAIERGVDGYVLKGSEPEQIVQAIWSVFQGNSVLPAHVMQKIARGETLQGAFEKLSPREREIVTYVARGLSNRAIGELLGLSENTVRNHLRSILEKLGLDNRVQVATFALQQGIVKKTG